MAGAQSFVIWLHCLSKNIRSISADICGFNAKRPWKCNTKNNIWALYNKNYIIKRDVIYEPLSAGGLNFVNFRTMVKSLRLSWIGRIIGDADCNTNWKVIPNYYFDNMAGWLFCYNAIRDGSLFMGITGLLNSETQRIVQNAIGSKFGHNTIIWLILFLVTRLNTKCHT